MGIGGTEFVAEYYQREVRAVLVRGKDVAISVLLVLCILLLDGQRLLIAVQSNTVGVQVLGLLASRAPYWLMQCEVQADKVDQEHASRMSAFALASSGKCQEAAGMWQQMLQGQPDDRLAWLRLGDVYMGMGDLPRAHAAWRQARAAPLLAARGKQAERKGDINQAEQWLMQAALVEDTPSATLELVKLYQRLGRKRDAMQVLETWVRRTGEGQAAYWLAVGMMAELDEHWAEAVQAYQRGLVLEPENASLLLRAKTALEKRQDWDGAIAVTKRLIELPGGSDGFWMLEIGRYESYRGNYEEGIAWVHKAQQNYKGLAWQPLSYLARIACAAGNLSSAMRYFDDALGLSPGNWELLYQKGMCIYIVTGDLATAQLFLEQATRHDEGQPGIQTVYLVLAKWYARSGQKEQAVSALERVLVLEPGNVIARQWLEGIQGQQ